MPCTYPIVPNRFFRDNDQLLLLKMSETKKENPVVTGFSMDSMHYF